MGMAVMFCVIGFECAGSLERILVEVDIEVSDLPKVSLLRTY